MRRALLILVASLISVGSLTAKDLVILRSGEEMNGDVEMISNGVISILTEKGKKSIPTNQVYMIKYERRGNAFFTVEGEMKYDTGNQRSKITENDIGVYLNNGQEIIISALKMEGDKIQLKPVSKTLISNVTNLFSKNKGWVEIPRNEIFLIRYGDGSKDIITPLLNAEPSEINNDLPSLSSYHRFVEINQNMGYPYPGKIILKDGEELPVILYDDVDDFIYFRKKSWQDGPIFRINKRKITTVTGIN